MPTLLPSVCFLKKHKKKPLRFAEAVSCMIAGKEGLLHAALPRAFIFLTPSGTQSGQHTIIRQAGCTQQLPPGKST